MRQDMWQDTSRCDGIRKAAVYGVNRVLIWSTGRSRRGWSVGSLRVTVPVDQRVSIAEAARRLGVSRQAIYWARDHHPGFPAALEGGRAARYDYRAIEHWWKHRDTIR